MPRVNQRRIEIYLASSRVNLITWKASPIVLLDTLLLENYGVIVDGSFFLEKPEYVSAYWHFMCNQKIVECRGFMASVPTHL